MNEPGFSASDPEAPKYNQIVEYKKYEVAIIGILTKKYLPDKFLGFYSIYKDHFVKHKEAIKKKLMEKSEIQRCVVSTRLYAMSFEVDYPKLYENFMENCYNKFSD